MGALVRMVNFQQEHADVSESLGRRLREEAEVNAALSQVSWPMQCWLKRACFPLQFEFTRRRPSHSTTQAKHAAEMQLLAQRAENKVKLWLRSYNQRSSDLHRYYRKSWPSTSSKLKKRVCRSYSR